MHLKMHLGCLFTLLAASAAAVSSSDGLHHHKRTVPIPDLQIPRGEKFIGQPATPKPIPKKPAFQPPSFNMHQDGGNTGTADSPGPLGKNLTVDSFLEGLHILLWSRSGQMVGGYTTIGASGLKWGLAAVDNDMNIQTTWFPEEDGVTLNVAYMELMLDTDQIVATSKEGQVYIVKLDTSSPTPSLSLSSMLNLTSTLAPGELLMNAMYDSDSNLWFSSGGLRAQYSDSHGDVAQNSSTIGYLPNGGSSPEHIHAMHLPNQMIENGIAIAGTTAYVITGPSGEQEHAADATGYVVALAPEDKDKEGQGIKTLWNATYAAGSIKKPGAYARGSGATPALLDDKFLAMTDNADARVNMVIFELRPADEKPEPVCSIPLFAEGRSAIDIAPLVQRNSDGESWGVFLCNDFHAPPLYYVDTGGLNGDWNNLTQMSPGIARVDVSRDGECRVKWETPQLRIQSVPVVSNRNGLVYGYTQAEEGTDKGVYVWYVVAVDWETGQEVWRMRAGAGGTFNDDYQPGALGPDGSFYQSVIGGVVRVRDGE